MRLYRFTFTDTLNESEAVIRKYIEQFLEKEAELLGWAEGYTYHAYISSRRLKTGAMRYYIQVDGSYITPEIT